MDAATQTVPEQSPQYQDKSNQFSLGDLFGMFLTLSLCLLTQPYGSLLYRLPSEADGTRLLRALFFLWRLNLSRASLRPSLSPPASSTPS